MLNAKTTDVTWIIILLLLHKKLKGNNYYIATVKKIQIIKYITYYLTMNLIDLLGSKLNDPSLDYPTFIYLYYCYFLLNLPINSEIQLT